MSFSQAAKWRFDLAAEAGSARGLADPPGFVDKVDETAATGAALVKQKAADTQIAVSRAWEFARSPLQQAFMMVMMMWMSGSGVQIFSIMITFTGLWQASFFFFTLRCTVSSAEMRWLIPAPLPLSCRRSL